MPKDVKYFPKEAGQVFNPGRNKYEQKPGESRYLTHWKRGFFRLYGRKEGGSTSFIMDPYIKAVIELSIMRDGEKRMYSSKTRKYVSHYSHFEPDLDVIKSQGLSLQVREYYPDDEIQSNIGGLDILNPLIPLSLLCITLSRAMSIKGDQLRKADKTGDYVVLKFFQGAFNALLTLPLTAVALLTTLLWDAVKATIAAVTTTFSSMVTAPVDAARENNRYVVL